MEVYNKIDKIENKDEVVAKLKAKGGVFVSAFTGEGVDDIIKVLAQKLKKSDEIKEIKIDMSDGKKLAEVYRKYEVLNRIDNVESGEILLKIRG